MPGGGTVQEFKRRVVYVLWAAAYAYGYFWLSFAVIFVGVADEDVLVATIWNLALIPIILISEKVEIYISCKIKSKIKKKPTILMKSLNVLFDVLLWGASFKSALYFFYIGLIICLAIVAADPDFPALTHIGDYLRSIRYGILVLIAADKFLEQVFKDLKSPAAR